MIHKATVETVLEDLYPVAFPFADQDASIERYCQTFRFPQLTQSGTMTTKGCQTSSAGIKDNNRMIGAAGTEDKPFNRGEQLPWAKYLFHGKYSHKHSHLGKDLDAVVLSVPNHYVSTGEEGQARWKVKLTRVSTLASELPQYL